MSLALADVGPDGDAVVAAVESDGSVEELLRRVGAMWCSTARVYRLGSLAFLTSEGTSCKLIASQDGVDPAAVDSWKDIMLVSKTTGLV
jgi:hypothetical protein